MEQQTFKRHSNRYQMKMKNNNNNSLTNVLIIFIMIILLSAIGIIGGQQPMSVDAFHLTGVTLTVSVRILFFFSVSLLLQSFLFQIRVQS